MLFFIILLIGMSGCKPIANDISDSTSEKTCVRFYFQTKEEEKIASVEVTGYAIEEISMDNLVEDTKNFMDRYCDIKIDDIWYEEERLCVDLNLDAAMSLDRGSYAGSVGLDIILKTFSSYPNVKQIEILVDGERGCVSDHFMFDRIFEVSEIKSTDLVTEIIPSSSTVPDSSTSPENTKWWVEELCEENIIGTWQSSNHVASAYTELFIFRSDYTFTYYKSEYNYTERELNFSGRWGFENNMLIIQKEYRTRIEGGSLREGVLTGTQEYIGGEVVFENIEPAITLNIYLSQFIDQTIDGIVLEEKNITYPSLYMNKVQYWRLAQSDISSELKHSSN